MNAQLHYHTAQAHSDDLLRAAKAARTVDGLPRRNRFARFGHFFANARLVARRPGLRAAAGDADAAHA